MNKSSIEVLYEDNHLLVVNKPARLTTQGVRAHEVSLVSLVREYIKWKYSKPGNVYVGVVSRLDRLATGAIVLARTSKAAARMTELFRSRQVEKTYWAAVEGLVMPSSASWSDRLWHNDREERVVVVNEFHPGGQSATLSYRCLVAGPQQSLLEIRLETGRKHQIRVQLSSRGFPILGDRKYNSSRPFGGGIALHSRELRFEHPVRKERIQLVAPTPQIWKKLGLAR